MSETSDVYAPPAATENEAAPTPRGALSRAATTCAALLMGSLVSALLLRLSALTSSGLFAAGVYQWLFFVHERLAVAFGSSLTLLLLCIASPIDARDRWRQRAFEGARWLAASELLVLALLPPLGLPSVVARGALHLTSAAVSGCLIWGALRCLPVSYLDAAVLFGAALGSLFSGVREDFWFLLCMAGLSSRWRENGPAASIRDPRFPTNREPLLLLGVPLAFHSQFDSRAMSAMWAIGVVWFAILVWRRMTPPIPLASRLLARAGLALFALYALTAAPLRMMSVDVHLHDTLFVVASDHAGVLGLTSMAFAAALRELPTGRVKGRGLRVGMLLCLTGSIGFVAAFGALGSRGDPRRYQRYLPEFVELQRVASLSTLALMVGVLIVVLALTRQARNSDASPRW